MGIISDKILLVVSRKSFRRQEVRFVEPNSDLVLYRSLRDLQGLIELEPESDLTRLESNRHDIGLEKFHFVITDGIIILKESYREGFPCDLSVVPVSMDRL